MKRCRDCNKKIMEISTFCKSCSKKGQRNPMFGKVPPTAFKKGHIPWHTGTIGVFKHSEETKKKISKNSAGNAPWRGKKQSKEMNEKKSCSMKEGFRLGKIKPYWLGKKFSEEHKRKQSKGVKRNLPSTIFKSEDLRKLWKENKESMIKRIAKGLRKKGPTSFEKKIIELCREFKLAYKFVGDGRFFINYKNPDFISIDGKKRVIETYSLYWHKKNYRIQRRKHFARCGFKTIFLNEKDLLPKNWKERCLKKIRKI